MAIIKISLSAKVDGLMFHLQRVAVNNAHSDIILVPILGFIGGRGASIPPPEKSQKYRVSWQ